MNKRLHAGRQNIDNFIRENDVSQWQEIEINSMYIRQPTPILVVIPEPDTSELIDIMFSTTYNDEAMAAALLLKENEYEKEHEFRKELIEELESINLKQLDYEQKIRLRNIIVLTELSHGENRRNVFYKDRNQIKADNAFFLGIAERAEHLLQQLKPSLFERAKKVVKDFFNNNA